MSEQVTNKKGKKSVFRESSIQRLSSPEGLKDYIKVTSVSVWLVLAAILLALAGLFTWALAGSIDVSDVARGVADGKSVTCYVSDASKIREGMNARVGDVKGVVASISAKPTSREVLADQYEAYVIYDLDPADFSYQVTLEMEEEISGVVSAQIVLETVKPIAFMLD